MTLHRLQMTDGLADGFRGLAVDTLRKLNTDVARGDVTLEEYDASNPQVNHEVEIHVPAAGTTPHAVIQALNDMAQLPVFDGADKTIRNLRFHVIAVQRTGASSIFLFRKYSKTKELSRSKRLVTLFQGGTFDQINEPIFIFDDMIDAAWVDGHMIIFRKDNYQALFGYFTEVLKHAQATIDTIKSTIPIDNADQFEKDCKGNTLILIKLRSISGRTYLTTLTIDNLEAIINARGLPIAISGAGANRKLVYDPVHKWKFLRLIDDGFLSSDATGLHYEVTGKRAI